MTRAVKGQILDKSFSFPFRMILAGSSGAGKTHFAGQLLEREDLLEESISAVHYYYPCYLTEAPVNWHKTLTISVSYHIGLPTKSDLMQLEKNSCVVIDDSFDEALKSSAIDHLFRVISGKRNICVMIMTQNNFSKGKYGRGIRNSCNFSVLFRNCCDVSINENIARMAGIKKAYDAAYSDVQGQKYPYMLLDQSQKGQLSPYRLYTNIFDRFPICYSVNGMKAYVTGAQDFELFFEVFTENNKFSANELTRTKPTKTAKVKKVHSSKKPESQKQPESKSNIEWGSDSEWSSENDIYQQSDVRKPKQNDRRRKRSSEECERERFRRQFEQTIY